MHRVGVIAAALAMLAGAASADPTPVHRKKHAAAKKTPAAPTPLVKPQAVATPPGAQLGSNRTIDAPQAPGPDSSPPREVVRAKDVQPTRDAKQHDVQPPYPTGYDPGRNMQPTQGFAPSSQSVVP